MKYDLKIEILQTFQYLEANKKYKTIKIKNIFQVCAQPINLYSMRRIAQTLQIFIILICVI